MFTIYVFLGEQFLLLEVQVDYDSLRVDTSHVLDCNPARKLLHGGRKPVNTPAEATVRLHVTIMPQQTPRGHRAVQSQNHALAFNSSTKKGRPRMSGHK